MGVDGGDFEEWYVQVAPRLVAALALVAGDVETSRDAVAEACIRALERWERVGRMDSPAAWAYTVALNELRRRQRRARTEQRAAARLAPLVASVAPSEPDLALWDAVASLPDRQRQAIVLRYVLDLTQEQVAEAMQVAAGTAAATLRDARHRLATLVSHPIEEVPR
jgi:RNA polymerase sigma-70 factor (ECF subfamily)